MVSSGSSRAPHFLERFFIGRIGAYGLRCGVRLHPRFPLSDHSFLRRPRLVGYQPTEACYACASASRTQKTPATTANSGKSKQFRTFVSN
jgi:hypothetical protein